MRLTSFPLAIAASVALGTVYFAIVFALIAHIREPSAEPLAFPILVLLWLSPGLLCAGTFAATSHPSTAGHRWLWPQVAFLAFVVPFVSLALYAFVGTIVLSLTGAAL